MERIYQKSHKVPLRLIHRGMKSKIQELKKRYGDLGEKYVIKCSWIPGKSTLVIGNQRYGIQAFFVFEEKKVVCYLKMPLYLQIIGKNYIKRILKEAIREINIYLKSFNK